MENENTIMERVSNWIKHSITLKLITITILMLLLLIPASMIQSIIAEREQLSKETIEEISSKWANGQEINGPILSIPLIYEHVQDEKKVTSTQLLHLLPESLMINGQIAPEKLRRGIYEVVVYQSVLNFSGHFKLDPTIDLTDLKEIRYDQAFITIGLSDLRGIKNQVQFKWGKEMLPVDAGTKIPDINSGITIKLPDIENELDKVIDFSFNLDLKGSQNLSFIPVGSNTNVQVASNWKSPSFNGNLLPEARQLNEDGFSAKWNVLQLNRNFPKSWIGSTQFIKMNSASFGVDLLVPLDDYQKSTRSAKYAVMTIALTFLIFFLVEILNKRKIHPFQYILVGLALCLFYVLLVSISEHSNFNLAYGISTLSIVSMITCYSLTIFKTKHLTLLLVTTLCGIYGFLFVTLQLADYALLMGSIGLTLILAATMYFTRNINWYRLNAHPE